MLKNWNPDKLKKDILDILENNAEVVGQFVEDDARRRLLAQRNLPKWEIYRRKMVAGGLAHEVKRENNAIVIKVGVRTSERSRRHGFWIEMGSKRYPANPYLRPAVFQNANKIITLLTGK